MSGGRAKDLDEALRAVEEARDGIIYASTLAGRAADETERMAEEAADEIARSIGPGIDRRELAAFAGEPYVILPRAENEAWVVAPRFVDFSVGVLERRTRSYNVFVVNKYVDWIEELPSEIRDSVGIEPRFDEAIVEDGSLTLSSEDERDDAWDELGGYVGAGGPFTGREGERSIRIKSGAEFEVVADLIDMGNLPFAPSPIDEDALRAEPDGISLRGYQSRAWETLLETGMIGVYWPPGAGKTYLSLYAGERIAGEKLVVVPSSTLEQQWRERIEEIIAPGNRGEWEVRTYQYLTTRDNINPYARDGPALIVFDECHYLPANTFSKLATIDADHRIGLSATPYREDGRTDYIFALTGHPVGMRWQELVELGVVETPDADVFLYSTMRQKERDLPEIASGPGKTVVFCDSIERGERAADELGAPFVNGRTPKSERMEILKGSRVVVASRAVDEGVSLPDVERVVEHDFHGASRRQEAQRYGRLMHGEGPGRHIVQMTDEEYEAHSDRLLSLEQQGVSVRVVRRE